MQGDKKDSQFGIDSRQFKGYLVLITFGIILLVGLLNLSVVLKYLGVFLDILNPVLIGLGVAFVLNIPMSFIETHFLGFIDHLRSVEFRKKHKNDETNAEAKPDRSKLKRFISIFLTFFLLFSLLSGLITFVLPQLVNSANTLVEKFPAYYASFNQLLDDLVNMFNLPSDIISQILERWDEFIKQFATYLLNMIPEIYDATVSVTVTVFNSLMGMILSIYMLADKERLLAIKDKLLFTYVKKDRADFIDDVSQTANQVFHGFIAGQITEAFILGTLCALGLAILQVPYALLIGVLVGATSIIPVFGAFLGAVPSGFILLIVDPIYCLIFVVYILILQQVESNLIYPRVVGGSIGLSGIWVLLGMLIGGSLFGFLGIILGIPSFAVFYAVFRKVTNERIEKMEQKKLV
jgi:predicted PurR-regulated permease PerM